MKKNLPFYIYGAVLIFAGIFLLVSKHFTYPTIKYTLGITLIIGAILAFSKAISRQRKLVELTYHEINALGMMIYGILIIMFANTLEALAYFSSFLMLFYAFSEIIFCSWLFNLGRKVIFRIIFIRLFLGLMVGIGSVLIMYLNSGLYNLNMEGFGVLFIIIGLNVLLYIPVMKSNELNKAI